MKRFLFSILLLASVVMAGQNQPVYPITDYQANIIKDTAQLVRASAGDTSNTAIWYSKRMPLANAQALMLDIMVNDTGVGGYKADSTKLVWGITTWTQEWSFGNVLTWRQANKIAVDTMNFLDSANFTATVAELKNDGTYLDIKKYIDTTTTLGAFQHAQFAVPPDAYYQGWCQFLTGNTHTARKKVRLNAQRRGWDYVQVKTN